jgi:hypothetical protein
MPSFGNLSWSLGNVFITKQNANLQFDDVVSRDSYPQMKSHPLCSDNFLALSAAAEVAGKTASTQSQWSQHGPGRLLFEASVVFSQSNRR